MRWLKTTEVGKQASGYAASYDDEIEGQVGAAMCASSIQTVANSDYFGGICNSLLVAAA
jgi:hypothetical protein